MFRRVSFSSRQAVKKIAVLVFSALLLASVFAAVPYIVAAIPEFTARDGDLLLGTGEAAPAFALSPGGVYPRGSETSAVSEAEILPDDIEQPIPDPIPGEEGLPVFAKNLCWYDDPAEAALNVINRTKYTVTLSKYAAEKFPLRGRITEDPLVLVVHTHGSESYLQNGAEFYDAGETFRSPGDDSVTVVHIGDVLCERLEELGIPVKHDRTMYDLKDFNKSYTYSREGIVKALEENPSIKFVIDLHRDSIFNSSNENIKPLTEIEGIKTAQLMIVVGTDEGGAVHPYWRRNLVVATHLQTALNEFFPTLARPINVRSGAFNQSLSDGSILVECGSCGNTVEEAENAILRFAEAYAFMLKEEYDG